ncbi:hypothetical protein ACNOYE_18730 [Nannocystaceae bacterium ST9]
MSEARERCSCPQCRRADTAGTQHESRDCSYEEHNHEERNEEWFADRICRDNESPFVSRNPMSDFDDVEDQDIEDMDFREDDELDDDLDTQGADLDTDEIDDLDFRDEVDDDFEAPRESDDDENSRDTRGCACAKCRKVDAHPRDARRPTFDEVGYEGENAELDLETEDVADGAPLAFFDLPSSETRGLHDDLDEEDEVNQTDPSRDDLIDEFDDEDALEDLLDELDADDDLVNNDQDDEESSAEAFEEAWDVGHYPRARQEDNESLLETMGELDFLEAPWNNPDHDGRTLTWDELRPFTDPMGNNCHAIQKLKIWRGQKGDRGHLADDVYIRRLCEAVNLARGWLDQTKREIREVFGGGDLLHARRRWNAHPSFPYWFGWGVRTVQQMRAVRTYIFRMRRWFYPSEGAYGLRFVVVKEAGGRTTGAPYTHLCTLSNAAYTLSPVVHLCPAFFEGTDPDDTLWRAEIIIHELTHRLVQRPAALTALGIFPGTQLGFNFNPALWAALDHPGLTIRGGGFRRPTGQSNNDRRIARMLAHNRPLAARRSPTNWAILVREIGHDSQPGGGGRRHPL